jgi:hypothetical protein
MRRVLNLPLCLPRPDLYPSSGLAWIANLRTTFARLRSQFQSSEARPKNNAGALAASRSYPEFAARHQQAFFR